MYLFLLNIYKIKNKLCILRNEWIMTFMISVYSITLLIQQVVRWMNVMNMKMIIEYFYVYSISKKYVTRYICWSIRGSLWANQFVHNNEILYTVLYIFLSLWYNMQKRKIMCNLSSKFSVTTRLIRKKQENNSCMSNHSVTWNKAVIFIRLTCHLGSGVLYIGKHIVQQWEQQRYILGN